MWPLRERAHEQERERQRESERDRQRKIGNEGMRDTCTKGVPNKSRLGASLHYFDDTN